MFEFLSFKKTYKSVGCMKELEQILKQTRDAVCEKLVSFNSVRWEDPRDLRTSRYTRRLSAKSRIYRSRSTAFLFFFTFLLRSYNN